MKLPLVNQVSEILAIQPGCDDAVEGRGLLQASTAQPRCGRVRRGRERDGTACTTVVVDGHLTLTRQTQRYVAVAAQAAKSAVVGEEPVEQAHADVVNHRVAAGLTG